MSDKLYSTGFPHLDLVLSEKGGVRAGSVVLVVGPPGVGKSTLVLQALAAIAAQGRALFACGEMSAHDVHRHIAARLNIGPLNNTGIEGTGDVLAICDKAKAEGAICVGVDSLQTSFVEDVGGDCGLPAQMNAAANVYTSFAQREDTAVFLIGHLNRAGGIAGPGVIQHLVDTILRLAPVEGHPHVVMVSIAGKNRHGRADARAYLKLEPTGFRQLTEMEQLDLVELPRLNSGTAAHRLKTGKPKAPPVTEDPAHAIDAFRADATARVANLELPDPKDPA